MALSRGPLPLLDPHVANRASQPAQTQSRSLRHGPLGQGSQDPGVWSRFGLAARLGWATERTGKNK